MDLIDNKQWIISRVEDKVDISVKGPNIETIYRKTIDKNDGIFRNSIIFPNVDALYDILRKSLILADDSYEKRGFNFYVHPLQKKFGNENTPKKN